MPTPQKTKPKISVPSTIAWVFRLIYSYSPLLIISTLITQVFAVTIPFAEQRFLSSLIDSLIQSLTQHSSSWMSVFVIFFAIRTIKIIFLHIQRLLQRTLDLRVQNDLRKTYLNKTSTIDYQQLEDKDIANLLSKVQEEYQWRTRQVITDLFELFGHTISFTTVLILLIPHYWYLTLLLIIGEIPGLLVDKKWQKIDWENFNKYNEKNRPAWDVHWQLSNKRYIAELKINQAINWLKNKFTSAYDEWTNVRIQNRINKFGPDFITSLISVSIGGICMLFIIKDINNGFLTIGMFTFYFNIIRNTGDYFSSILNRYVSITEQVLHINNFRKIIDLPHAINNGQIKKGLDSIQSIEFRDVSFKYPNSHRFVFQHLNLVIKAEEEIAIIGQNGAGKTTLVKLLCRFYDPTKGQILVNGIDLRQYDLGYWYQQLSLLTQEFNIYQNLSLGENIQIGNIGKSDNKSIISSLKKSEAYGFVSKYTRGLDTPMGQRYGGEEPSWGQWQKIAIARVFHRNSPLMILDEPTASIDAIAESKIFNRLYQQINHKILIIISHRFSTVRNAGRIIVIDKGQIVEQGSHQQLIKKKGLYAHSFHLQAQGYQK